MWTIILENGAVYKFETKEECFEFYWALPAYSGWVEIYQPNGKKY